MWVDFRSTTRRCSGWKEELFCKTPANGFFLNLKWIGNFTKFSGEDLWWSLFLYKVAGWRSVACLKWGSSTVLSLRVVHLFCKTLVNGWFWSFRQTTSFEKLTGKHLWWSFFLYEVASQRIVTLHMNFAKLLRTPIMKNTCEHLVLKFEMN